MKNILLLFLLFAFSSLSYPPTEDSSDEDSRITLLDEPEDVEDLSDEVSKNDTHNYTLLLLDPSLVHRNDDRGKEFFWPFLSHNVQKSDLKIRGEIDEEYKGFVAIKYLRPFQESHAESLINLLTETTRTRPVHQESPVFMAGLIFFKERIGSNSYYPALALGKSWLSLVNADALVRDFGLHLCISAGIFFNPEDKDEDIQKIKEVTVEELRLDNPEKIKRRNLKTFKKFTDFALKAGEIRISQIRILPLRTWGRSLLTGADWLKFREEVDEDNPIPSLQKKIKELCEVFSRFSIGTIYEPFKAYVDAPIDQKLAGSLNDKISQNWGKFCEKGLIFPHDKYWFRVRDEKEREKIFEYITHKKKSINLLEDKVHDHPIKFLIRSLPIELEGKYYWFDSGHWYEISETRTKAMYTELSRCRVDYKTKLLLPAADWASLEAEKRGKEDKNTDYKEQHYNKMALREISEALKKSSGSWVRMLDRTNTKLTDGGKFEFADLILKHGADYYLIHVKRAKTGSTEFGHLCTQIERCIEYLSGSFDRTELLYPFILAEWAFPDESFLDKYKQKKHIVRKYRLLNVFSSSSGRRKKIDEFIDYMRSTTKKKANEKDFIDEVIATVSFEKFDFDFWMEMEHQLQLFFCLDYLKARVDEKKPFTQKFLQTYFNCAQAGIKKAEFFTKDRLLKSQSKSHIHMIAALIEDKPFKLKKEAEDSYDTNKILRMYQSLNSASSKHFKFAWTTIPKELSESFWEHPYSNEDLSNILLLKTEAIQIYSGDKKKQDQIFVHKNKKIFILKPSSKGKKTPKKRAEICLEWLIGQKKVDEKTPFSILIPYLTDKEHWVIGQIQFNPTLKTVEINIFSSQKIKEKKQKEAVLDRNINDLMRTSSKSYQMSKEIDALLKRLFGDGFKVAFKDHETFLKASKINGGPFVIKLINHLLFGSGDLLEEEYAEVDVKRERLQQFKDLLKAGKNLEKKFVEEDGRESPILERSKPSEQAQEVPDDKGSSNDKPNSSGEGPDVLTSSDNDDDGDDIEKAKKESLQAAEKEKKIGPRGIPEFQIKDVKADGNCFYYAICDQLGRLKHEFMKSVQKGTAEADSLRLKIQGSEFKDKEWAGQEEMIKFVESFSDIILCYIDTRHPDNGFACYFFDEKNNKVEEYNPMGKKPLPKDKKIIRLAFTGNHYMSVISHPALENGVIKAELKEKK